MSQVFPNRCLLIICAISVLLGGCTTADPYADIRAKMEEIKRRPKGKIQPPPEFKTYENFIYSASLLRSPFVAPMEIEPLQVIPEGRKVTPDFNRTPEPLEDFSVEALNMVGTIQRPDDSLFALILDNKSGIHRVTVGNYMGRNHGKISAIGETKLDLIELIPDGQGGWVERPRTILLREE